MTESEIVSQNYRYDNEALRDVASFEDAFALVESTYGPVLTADSELGDGFAMLEDKDKRRLVGVPILFLSWSFSKGDYSEEFVSARVVTKDGGKYVLNDGGTGIRAQLREFTNTHAGRTGGLLSRRGLRASEYKVCDGSKGCGHSPEPIAEKSEGQHKGVITPAATFYVDTGA